MTLTEIMVSIRELSFDRYPIPVFVLKQKAGKAATNNATDFRIHPPGTPLTPNFTYAYTPNYNSDTVENLANALISGGYPIAYTGYYSSQDSANTLLLLNDIKTDLHTTYFRRFFLSDARIQKLIEDYYCRILRIDPYATGFVLATEIQTLEARNIRHLTLWVAIQLVELRRVAEVGASAFSFNFTDGTGAIAGSNLSQPGQNITVSIGSVFTLTDDNSITSQYFSEQFSGVGSENVLGDKETFWFKLYLWLRKKLEGEFQDFQFRDDMVIFGQIQLTKDINYLSYFDSYPFTYNTFVRGVISNR